MKKYDYLIVGSGLYGATFAHFAAEAGKKCLVIDKRPHLGGNVYCGNVEGITCTGTVLISSTRLTGRSGTS